MSVNIVAFGKDQFKLPWKHSPPVHFEAVSFSRQCYMSLSGLQNMQVACQEQKKAVVGNQKRKTERNNLPFEPRNN